MSTLVTGAAGFIGFHVANALMARGVLFVGIDSLIDYYDQALKQARLTALRNTHGNAFAFEPVDFSDQEALDAFATRHEFDRIVHLGAQAGVGYSLINPQAYARSNLLGQVNMLELARARRVRHFVYASSSSVYGGNKTLPFRVEDRVDNPVSLYAATKKADELMSESYAHLFRVPMTGLRFFTVYGPWGRPDMAMWVFTKALFEGTPLKVNNDGDMRRDFTFITDIVSGVLACLDAPPADDGALKAGGSMSPHAIYNIGNNRSEDLLRMISVLEQATGREAKLDFAPMQPGDVKDTYADISAIERDHGFVPTTGIDDGIPLFVDWFKDYHGIA
jgi:UDP-glucuronate 4-epimerase